MKSVKFSLLALGGLAVFASSSYGAVLAEPVGTIPEPATVSLACLGGLAVLLFRRRK